MLLRLTSDHWPILLNTSVQSFRPKPFKFENMWATHPSFKGLVHNWWNEFGVGGWGGFSVMKKLFYVEGKLLE